MNAKIAAVTTKDYDVAGSKDIGDYQATPRELICIRQHSTSKAEACTQKLHGWIKNIKT